MPKNSKTRLKDIAQEVGVSITTVSRVLSGLGEQYRISKGTQDKIAAAAKQKRYTVNYLAQSLRLRKTNMIGLLVPDIANPFFAAYAQEIELKARQLGYAIILCDSGGDASVEADSIALLMSRQVSGLFIFPVGEKCDHLQKLCRKEVPVVLVDRYFPDLAISYVSTDNYEATYQATRYLIECGHRRIGCIQGLHGVYLNKSRLNGYKDALAANGLDIEGDLIKGDGFSTENGYQSTLLLLNNPCPPTAILAFSNQITLGALIALKEKKINVPDDISIIAFDEQPYSDYLSLTTIKQQTDQIGKMAIKLLLDQMTGGIGQQERILLPSSLIIRNSVKIIQDAPKDR